MPPGRSPPVASPSRGGKLRKGPPRASDHAACLPCLREGSDGMAKGKTVTLLSVFGKRKIKLTDEGNVH